MAPFNQRAAQQYPMVAQQIGYSPVAELLAGLGDRPTTGSLLPMGVDPMSLLQGISGLQNEQVNNQARRFGLVSNRMSEAERAAEERALQRRINAQNQALVTSSPSSGISSGGGYTGPVPSAMPLPNIAAPITSPGKVKLPKISAPRTQSPTMKDLVFPLARPMHNLTAQHLYPYMNRPKIPSGIVLR